MTTLPITAIYAALLGIILIILRIRVTIVRAKTGISIYHGDNKALAEKIRQHANFTENIPYALILMVCVELAGASSALLYVIGSLLLASRLLNPFGIKHERANHPLRIISGIMTVAPMAISIMYFLKLAMFSLS